MDHAAADAGRDECAGGRAASPAFTPQPTRPAGAVSRLSNVRALFRLWSMVWPSRVNPTAFIAKWDCVGVSTAVLACFLLGITLAIVGRIPGIKGFVVLPRRWVVERTFGSLG